MGFTIIFLLLKNYFIGFIEVRTQNINELATLSKSGRLNNVMNKIEELRKSNVKSNSTVNGHVEADPEYILIVDANNLAVEIDNEICK